MITSVTIQKVLAAIKRPADYDYFFDSLRSPDWIGPLMDAEMFGSPPVPEREGNYIRFPAWAASRYLVRMAPLAPKKVCDIILAVPATDNVRVHDDFVAAALAIPPQEAKRLEEKIKEWLHSPYLTMLPEKLSDLVIRLAEGGEINAALGLAYALLKLHSDPRGTEKQNAGFSAEPHTGYEHWLYEEVLHKIAIPLADAAGQKALPIFCDVLAEGIRYSLGEEEAYDQDDSYIWRPAIEDHEQNTGFSLLSDLVTAARDIAWHLSTVEPDSVPGIVALLESYSPQIFRRVALHLLRTFPEGNEALIADRLSDHSYFTAPGLHHEYTLLAQSCFEVLSAEQKEVVLGGIWEAISVEQIKQIHREHFGEELSDEKGPESIEWQRLERLTPLRNVLPAEWRKRLDHLEAKYDTPKHPEFVFYTSGVVSGSTSPISSVEMSTMEIDGLIDYLHKWEPSNEPIGPSREGLGRTLEALVASNPVLYSSFAERFEGLDPTYVRSFLSGLREAVKQSIIEWQPALNLCSWVLSQPLTKGTERQRLSEGDPGWEWSREAVVTLLSEGLGGRQFPMPADFQTEIWSILRPLTDDPSPTADYEMRYGGSNMDTATLSLNTVRGQAMHALFQYALWLCWSRQDEPPKEGFSGEGLTDVRKVLEKHLDPTVDSSLAIRAVYGQHIPVLLWLDSRWTEEHIAQILPFSEKQKALRDAAWDTFVKYTSTANVISAFELLQNQYELAVERLGQNTASGPPRSGTDQSLAHHLMILYLHGCLSLEEGSLLVRFYQVAPDTIRAEALGFVGHDVYHREGQELEASMVDRIRSLWLSRQKTALEAGIEEHQYEELAKFGWLFASGRFEDEWSMEQLIFVAKTIGRPDPYHLVIERLGQLAPSLPELAIEALTLMAKHIRQGKYTYTSPEDTRAVLAAVLQKGNEDAQSKAVRLIHWYGARGEHDFEDLLSGL